MARRSNEKGVAKGGLAGVGLAAFMVVCCAAFPLLAAFAGSVALGAALGVGAGVVALLVLGGLVVAAARRRRVCEAEPSQAGVISGPRSEDPRR